MRWIAPVLVLSTWGVVWGDMVALRQGNSAAASALSRIELPKPSAIAVAALPSGGAGSPDLHLGANLVFYTALDTSSSQPPLGAGGPGLGGGGGGGGAAPPGNGNSNGTYTGGGGSGSTGGTDPGPGGQPVPAPGAALLAMLGMGLVSWIRRRA